MLNCQLFSGLGNRYDALESSDRELQAVGRLDDVPPLSTATDQKTEKNIPQIKIFLWIQSVDLIQFQAATLEKVSLSFPVSAYRWDALESSDREIHKIK